MGFSKSKTLLPIPPLIICFFFLLSCSSLFVLSHSTISASNIIDETRVALLSFKSRLSDPNNTLASWGDNNNNKSLPIPNYCNWRGVTCGRRHPQIVIALELNSLGLAGPISPSLSNLTFLRTLHLADNHLDGIIREELGRLSRLQYLNLSINSLQGTIPGTLSQCSSLKKISLRDNALVGAIPSNLTRCLRLQTLSLKNNMLGGEIPDGIASLPALEELLLGGNSLVGRIPPSLGSNPSLVYLELWNNSLSGHIPHSLMNSSTLEYLHLEGNSLTGEVPSLLGNNTSLVLLDLSSNSLTGSIPPFSMNPYSSSSPLIYLDLSENHLTGEIPSSLSNLSSLEKFSLSQNNLEGSIPESLGDIPNLSQLALAENRFSNEIPSSIYNISTITRLELGSNRLSGSLPPNIGLSLQNLEYIYLYHNQFQGPIPVSFCNASKLQRIDLGDNFLSGVVPSNLGSLQYLKFLNFANNSKLQAGDWSFFSSLANCSMLEFLFLDDNGLEGALPSTVGNLSMQLSFINIGNNQISGTIPAEIGNLAGLNYLGMYANLFTGGIPATIGKLRNLGSLDIYENRLTGTIPSSIGNLSQLYELYLEGNELSGTIPPTIGGCKILQVVDLSQNALQGSIPRELLSLSSLSRNLNVSYNYLVGSIPTEVGSLINLGILDVSENNLSGQIPSAIGSCLLLETLSMQGNSFQGSIPQSFVHLKGLKRLYLFDNKLSGQIPGFLRSLKILNLSFNDFDGEVPIGGVFSNASAFSVLGNKKLCGGDPIFQLLPCSVHHTHERKRKALRIIIPVISVAAILLLFLLGVLFYSRRKTRGQSPSSSFMDETFKKISYGEINKATGGFSSANLLGTGSFGSVYKGTMDSEERIVAVKVLHLNRKGASRSFIAECKALRSIRHRNLVKIITACSSLDHGGNEFKALVFEYMANGNLEQWLYSKADVENLESRKLTLIQRLNIAIDVVSALDYLHRSCDPPVVHRDLKPSNVLLDNDMIAHVGDFGLARLLREETFSEAVASNSSTSSLAGIQGTVGYVAPEYGMGSGASTKGDVYSFGVLLLEMMTAKRPTDDVFKDGLTLQKYVEMAYSGDDLLAVIDQRLFSENRDEDTNILDGGAINYGDCIRSLIRIGTSCANDVPKERMEIGDVADELRRIKEHFLTG